MNIDRRTGLAVLAAALALLAAWDDCRAQDTLSPPENERFYQNVEWSPDGQSIAFSEFEGGDYSPEKWSVFIARRDGSQWRRLATNALWVTWSPDGKRLAYSSRRTGNSEIFVVDPGFHLLGSVDISRLLRRSRPPVFKKKSSGR